MAAACVHVSRVNCSYLLPLLETLQNQQVCLTQAPLKLLLLPWVLEHVRFCVHPLTVKSLFLSALCDSQKKALLAFKAICSVGLSSWCRTPGLGSLTRGLNLSFGGTSAM